jgi:hypothetical protein
MHITNHVKTHRACRKYRRAANMANPAVATFTQDGAELDELDQDPEV